MRARARPSPVNRQFVGNDAPPLAPIASWICRAFSHDWADPRAVAADLFRVSCKRCSRVLTGDWLEIERHRAWKHHRSPAFPVSRR
jgi:hypothetical protein